MQRFWKGLDEVPELYGTTFLITVGVIGVIYKATTEPEGGKMVRYKDRYMSESIMIWVNIIYLIIFLTFLSHETR